MSCRLCIINEDRRQVQVQGETDLQEIAISTHVVKASQRATISINSIITHSIQRTCRDHQVFLRLIRRTSVLLAVKITLSDGIPSPCFKTVTSCPVALVRVVLLALQEHRACVCASLVIRALPAAPCLSHDAVVSTHVTHPPPTEPGQVQVTYRPRLKKTSTWILLQQIPKHV